MKLPPDAIVFDPEDIPALLKRLRTQAGITQVQAAEKMGSHNQRAYEQYESGSASPSLAQLQVLLGVLGYKAAFFAVKPPMSGEKILKAAAAHTQVIGTSSKTILRKAAIA